MKKPIRWAANLILFLISLLLALFVLFSLFEIFPELPSRLNLTRIYYYALKARYIPDPALVMRIKPGFSQKGFFTGDISGLFPRSAFEPLPYEASYDEYGFRNHSPRQNAEIVVLGDSYMEVGLTNQDTFAAHLEKTIQRPTVNYGSGWYGPPQYLETLKRYGLAHKPKVAILGFFEGNDLKDILKYQNWTQGGSYYHFNLYNGNFFSRFALALQDTFTFAGKLIIRRWDPRRGEIKLGDQTFQTVFVYSPDPRSPEELNRSSEIRELKEILEEFKGICGENQIQPLLLFIPTKAHIYLPSAYRPSVSENEAKDQIRKRSNVENAVRKTAEETGVSWLSLVPVFEKAAQKKEFVFYETDTHWNTRGRQLAAEAVAAFLSRSKESLPA